MQTLTPTQPSATSHRKERAAKRIVFVVIAILALIGIGYGYLFITSTRAINDYRAAISTQFNQVIANQSDDAPAQLTPVLFGVEVNPNYRAAQNLSNDYNQLLTSVHNYNAVRSSHDKLVKIFNAGVEQGADLSADTLKIVQDYRDAISTKYPNETARVEALNNLATKLSGSIKFSDISIEMNKVLHDNDQWLDQLRNQINDQQSRFEQQINAL